MMTTQETNVARTILAQLGGNRFIAMTNGQPILDEENQALNVKLPRYKFVRIQLNGLDLYDIELKQMNTRTFEFKSLGIRKNVHVEELRNTFTELTGLYCTL